MVLYNVYINKPFVASVKVGSNLTEKQANELYRREIGNISISSDSKMQTRIAIERV